jgi:hypothetical protein
MPIPGGKAITGAIEEVAAPWLERAASALGFGASEAEVRAAAAQLARQNANRVAQERTFAQQQRAIMANVARRKEEARVAEEARLASGQSTKANRQATVSQAEQDRIARERKARREEKSGQTRMEREAAAERTKKPSSGQGRTEVPKQRDVKAHEALRAEFGDDVYNRARALYPEGGTPAEMRTAMENFSVAGIPNIRWELPRTSGKPLTSDLTVVGAPNIIKNVTGSYKRGVEGAKYDVGALTERYPETLPAEWSVDKKSGKPFLEKVYSPEETELQKARLRAQADINAGNYTPLFDPRKRDYVDPGNYPLIGNTLDNVPVKPETIARYEARARSPGAMGRLSSAYERMQGNPDAEHWYAMSQLEQAFIDQYGGPLGRQLFKERFAEGMASTTGGMDPRSNYLASQYGAFQNLRGDLIPTEKGQVPHPVGGRYLAGNIDAFNKIVGGRHGLNAVENPKRFDFAANFLGHRDRATLDEQISGLIEPGMTLPETSAYGVFERPLHELGDYYNVPAANFQDVAWAGGKWLKEPDYMGQPMIGNVNEAIERTARVTGQDPEEVLAQSILGAKRPTFADGGPVRRGDFAVDPGIGRRR